MSDKNKLQVSKNLVEWKEAVSKKQIKHYEYKGFNNIDKISTGFFGEVYRANWKNSEQYLALKLFKHDKATVKEIVHELELHRQVGVHENIIQFLGSTYKEENGQLKKYLVMEYADGGPLRDYLKVNFDKLTWEDKYKLAYQLTCAVSYLHDKEIIHRDLHSKNILIHQNIIKLADFGISKKIEETSKIQLDLQSDLIGVNSYIDPKKFELKQYSLNKKSDVYSVGVLLWEISSGQLPFKNELDFSLHVRICDGLREKVVSDTPGDYVKIYTECWNKEPDNRPAMEQVVAKLKEKKEEIISETNMIRNFFHCNTESSNINQFDLSIYNSGLSQMSQMIERIESNTSYSSQVSQMIAISFDKFEIESNTFYSSRLSQLSQTIAISFDKFDIESNTSYSSRLSQFSQMIEIIESNTSYRSGSFQMIEKIESNTSYSPGLSPLSQMIDSNAKSNISLQSIFSKLRKLEI